MDATVAVNAFGRIDDRVMVAIVGIGFLALGFVLKLVIPGATAGGWSGVAGVGLVTVAEVAMTALVVASARAQNQPLVSWGVTRPTLGAAVVMGGLVTAMFGLLVARATGSWTPPANTGIGAVAQTDAQRVALLVIGVPQIYLQELLFRGFSVSALESWLSTTSIAVVVSAGVFAVAHVTSITGGVPAVASVFAAGVVLGLLYLSTRTLWPVFVVHWVWVAWLAVGLSTNAR